MGGRWTAPGGWVVELADDGHGRRVFRVSRWRDWFIAYPADVEALQTLLARCGVRLEDLSEEDALNGWR